MGFLLFPFRRKGSRGVPCLLFRPGWLNLIRPGRGICEGKRRFLRERRTGKRLLCRGRRRVFRWRHGYSERTVRMLKCRKQLEPEHGRTDLEAGAVYHDRHIRFFSSEQRNTIHKGFAARKRLGTEGTEDSFPWNREPGIDRQLIAAGDDDHFPDVPCFRQGTEALAAFSPFVIEPGKGEEQEHQGKKGEKPA